MTDVREMMARAIAAFEDFVNDGGEDADGVALATDTFRAALDAAGWQCVPKEATEEMISAARGHLRQDDEWFTPSIWEVEAALKAALAAAPKVAP